MVPTTRPGRHSPLGATFDGDGVNFALFSEGATAVELCLFDELGMEIRVPVRERTVNVWHVYVAGLRPGQRYGYRVFGPYAPHEGHHFNPTKLLVDPYAKAVEGRVSYRPAIFGYATPEFAAPNRDDSAPHVPKCVVVDTRFDWGDDAPPAVPWNDTVVYEAHVKGQTRLHPGVPPERRGTYLGLASPASIEHFKRLGITTVELLPVQEAMTEWPIAKLGRENYWGYSTLAFFAPDQRYAVHPGAQVHEFKSMVRALHAAGIEVVLDVVYNHTAEGDHLGPTVSLRGVDNAAYYRLRHDNKLLCEDFTGCGNSLNMHHPQTLKLVMDSLRYWVTEMHVDGFRFDLASTLAREDGAVDKLSAFFDIIHQDPILSNVKLIAEPWDLGEGGYQVGNFPVLWTEWNGRFRDTVRRFYCGDVGAIGDLGYRLTGSSDLYEDDGRHPTASINFVTAHDGFTLRDLVSYEKKHNFANGEGNRDGWDDNISWNCGVEGETDDPAIVELRARQQRNFFLTLLLSQGVPMIAGGDEIGKTQRGNNNAYCQDNELSWLDWSLDAPRAQLLAYVRELVAFRLRHPVFRRRHFLSGTKVGNSELKDVAWFRPDGSEMEPADWTEPPAPVLGLLLAGDALDWRDDDGMPIIDDSFFMLLSSSREPVVAHLPGPEWGAVWTLRFDSNRPTLSEVLEFGPGAEVQLQPCHVCVWKRIDPVRGAWRPSVGVQRVDDSDPALHSPFSVRA